MAEVRDQIRTDPLAVLLPQCTDPAEKEVRQQMLTHRELASKRMAMVPYQGHAARLYWTACEAVAIWAYASAPLADLEHAAAYVRRLVLVASMAERMEGDTADVQ
jgi:hypothetical protein